MSQEDSKMNNDEDGFEEMPSDDDGEGWGDAYDEEEEDPREQARRLQAEIDNEKAIENNMHMIDEMREERDKLLDNSCQRLTNWKLIGVKRFIALLKKELAEEQKVPETNVDWSKLQEQACSICYYELYEGIKDMSEGEVEKLDNEQQSFLKKIDVVQMGECKGHFFHAECLQNQLGEGEFLKCAQCSHYYGIMRGKYPSGTMTISQNGSQLPGYEGNKSSGTWVIGYSLSGGVMEENNVSYRGDGRQAYLPVCPEGDEVMALLQIAFERKLIFQVGHSPTRGTDNVVCWNGVHHKTSTHGGPTSYGYPDQTFLERCKDELRLKNVFFNSEEEKIAGIAAAKGKNQVQTYQS